MNNLTKITANGIDFKVGNPIQVTWDSSSNMDNFKEPGVYEIYGERTKHDDNLPINNANTGHSFFARLTVIASTLQPANNEICITQMLLLSNRRGGDGNMYIRTYNENNSSFDNGWGLWKKFQGVEEGYIFTDTRKLNQDFGLQTYEVGLNYMVDNGTYSGVYVNEEAIIQNGGLDANGNGTGSLNTDISQVKFIETFNLVVINDYAVAGQVNNMLDSLGKGEYKRERQICQIKTSTDYFSGTSSIKKRVCKGNGDEYKDFTNWSDWEDIGGGGETVIDATPIFAQAGEYGLPGIINSEYKDMIQKDVTYEFIPLGTNMVNFPTLDVNNKIKDHFNTTWVSNGNENNLHKRVIRIKKLDSGWKFDITGYYYQYNSSYPYDFPPNHYEYLANESLTSIKVSSDYTDLE